MDRAIGLNQRASALARQLCSDAQLFGVRAEEAGGAALIDCGIRAPGGFEAGRRFSEICMAGLGQVSLTPWQEDGLCLPGVQVVTDHPATACLGSQYAGWAVKGEGYFAMGSGPARALVRAEKVFEHLPLQEQADEAVLCLEGRSAPGETLLQEIADRCGVAPGRLTVLIAPTASLVGSVQVSARVVETALHKLHELGFDVNRIRHGWGAAPLAPVAGGDLAAIGRTNDCILYGGRVHLTVDATDEELADVVARLPSSASRDFGRPFIEIYRQYGDFYQIDPLLFSPAQVDRKSVV